MKTVKEALLFASKILENANIENPINESYALLSYVSRMDRPFLYAHQNEMITQAEDEFYTSVVLQRANHKPFSYITGNKEFMGLNFIVDENVLIPRADTETLCECGISFLKSMISAQSNKTYIPDILDICTGSGAVGISIAYYVKSRLCLSDISPDALYVAKQNAKQLLSDEYNIIESDLFEYFDKVEFTDYFDLITANPPYIDDIQFVDLMSEVKDNEPAIALRAGENGVCFYEKIAPKAYTLLKRNGMLAVECGWDQAKIVAEIFSDYGYADIDIHCDLSNIQRVVTGIKR